MTYFIIVIKHHARERERHYFIIFIKHHARERERYCLRCLFLELFERLTIGSVPSALLSDAAGICQRPAAAPVFSSQNLLIIFIFIILSTEREVLFDVCSFTWGVRGYSWLSSLASTWAYSWFSSFGLVNTPSVLGLALATFKGGAGVLCRPDCNSCVHSACTHTNLSHSGRLIFSATIYSQYINFLR